MRATVKKWGRKREWRNFNVLRNRLYRVAGDCYTSLLSNRWTSKPHSEGTRGSVQRESMLHAPPRAALKSAKSLGAEHAA
jgi:hypothetical protein